MTTGDIEAGDELQIGARHALTFRARGYLKGISNRSAQENHNKNKVSG